MSSIPVARIGLNPTRVTSCDATPAAMMIETASGRYASPASIALKPSTFCI